MKRLAHVAAALLTGWYLMAPPLCEHPDAASWSTSE